MRVSDLGVTTLFESVTGLERLPDGLIRVTTLNGSHAARCVIVASGARLRKLGVPGEAELENRGVSHCADCDAPMLKGQTVMVVGGGDSALQEALVLTEFCPVVHLVHRGSTFSARAEFVEAVQRAQQIKVHTRYRRGGIGRLQTPSPGAASQPRCSGRQGALYGIFHVRRPRAEHRFLAFFGEYRGRPCPGQRNASKAVSKTCSRSVLSGRAMEGQLAHAIADARSVVGSAWERVGRT